MFIVTEYAALSYKDSRQAKHVCTLITGENSKTCVKRRSKVDKKDLIDKW